MKTVAILGGIGSGKSTVASQLASMGAGVVDLDAFGHVALLLPDVKDGLRKAFGPEVFGLDGEVDRAKLAEVAFASPYQTELLNAVTHPAIMEQALACVAELHKRHELVVVEVTSGEMTREAFPWADVVIAVSAPEILRIFRATARGGHSEEDVRARMARQATDEEREAIADFIIKNDGSLENLKKEVERVFFRLML